MHQMVAEVGQRKDLKRPTAVGGEIEGDSGRLKPARRASESPMGLAQRSCGCTLLACARARIVPQGELRWEVKGAKPACCGPRVDAPGPCEGDGRVESAWIEGCERAADAVMRTGVTCAVRKQCARQGRRGGQNGAHLLSQVHSRGRPGAVVQGAKRGVTAATPGWGGDPRVGHRQGPANKG